MLTFVLFILSIKLLLYAQMCKTLLYSLNNYMHYSLILNERVLSLNVLIESIVKYKKLVFILVYQSCIQEGLSVMLCNPGFMLFTEIKYLQERISIGSS